MGGRSWNPVKTDDPVIRELVTWLRGLVERSGLTVRDLAARCGCKHSTVSSRLSGAKMPSPEFVYHVIEACTPRSEWPRKKQQARELLARPRPVSRPPVVLDAYTRVVTSQAETSKAQAQTIRVLDELSHAKEQLIVSLRLEFQAAEIIRALRIVLMHLAGIGREFAGERELARTQLERADQERERAARLADAAQVVLEALGQRFNAGDASVATPVITSDAVMVDVPAGLASVQRILDEQEGQLGRLEAEASAEALAERLFAQYVDAPLPVAILDIDGRFLRVNEPFRKAVGYTADELGRMRLADVARSWTDWDDHVILPKEGEVFRYQLRRWTVSGFQIAVLENGDDSELGLPTKDWLKDWFDIYGGFRSKRFGVCQVSFNTESILDEAWDSDELRMRLSRGMFHLTTEGRLVVEVDPASYLLFIDGNRFGLDEFVEYVRPVLTEIGEGLPFTLDAADCGIYRATSPDELLWHIDTSARWAAVEGRNRLWIVREPVFRGAAPDVPSGEPLLYRPLSVFGHVRRVQVVNAISPTVFRGAVEQLRLWHDKGQELLDLDFVVTEDALRMHDWRGELPNELTLNMHVRLMFDGLPDFESYVLLRRFAVVGKAGVLSADPGILERAWKLALETPRANLVVGAPADARGIEALLNSSR